MTTLNSKITVSVSASLTGNVGMFSPTVGMNNVISAVISSTQGTMIYSDSVSTETANKTYDLIGAGAGVDPFGAAVDIDLLAAIVIENTHAAAFLHVTGLPAGMIKGSTPALIIPPGGLFVWVYPASVSNTTNFVFTGRNAADDANDDCTWDMVVIGKAA